MDLVAIELSVPKLTEEQKTEIKKQKFLADLKSIHGDQYELIGEYKDQSTKTKFKCKNHQEEIFNRQPSHLLQDGNGCPKCARKKSIEACLLSEEEIIKQIKEVHGEKYILLEPYKGVEPSHKFRCAVHGEIMVSPKTLIKGMGCSKCGIDKIKKLKEENGTTTSQTNEQAKASYSDKVIKKTEGRFEAFDEYIKSDIGINHKCTVCGGLHLCSPDNMLYTKRVCRACNPSKSSIHNILSFEDILNRLSEKIKDKFDIVDLKKFKIDYEEIGYRKLVVDLKCLVCEEVSSRDVFHASKRDTLKCDCVRFEEASISFEDADKRIKELNIGLKLIEFNRVDEKCIVEKLIKIAHLKILPEEVNLALVKDKHQKVKSLPFQF